MRRVLFASAVMLAAPAAVADEAKMLCFELHDAGFNKEHGGSWMGVGFKPVDRYILRPATPAERQGELGLGGRATHVLADAKTPDAVHACAPAASGKTLRCYDGVEDFRMNIETRRFTVFYMYGYVDGEDDDKDTPSVALGLCAPE